MRLCEKKIYRKYCSFQHKSTTKITTNKEVFYADMPYVLCDVVLKAGLTLAMLRCLSGMWSCTL
jgi:hypothetical protein